MRPPLGGDEHEPPRSGASLRRGVAGAGCWYGGGGGVWVRVDGCVGGCCAGVPCWGRRLPVVGGAVPLWGCVSSRGSVIYDPCSGEMNGNPLARVCHSAAGWCGLWRWEVWWGRITPPRSRHRPPQGGGQGWRGWGGGDAAVCSPLTAWMFGVSPTSPRNR